jgi:hypothetical protein
MRRYWSGGFRWHSHPLRPGYVHNRPSGALACNGVFAENSHTVLLRALTQGSLEINAAGSPYGFFHEPLESVPPGYPLLLDTRLSAKRAEEALTFIRDGGYLSATLTK